LLDFTIDDVNDFNTHHSAQRHAKRSMMADPRDIYESVLAEQEKFTELTKQLAAERISVANQLEKVCVALVNGEAIGSFSGTFALEISN
jgi:hypothetical protein